MSHADDVIHQSEGSSAVSWGLGGVGRHHQAGTNEMWYNDPDVWGTDG